MKHSEHYTQLVILQMQGHPSAVPQPLQAPILNVYLPSSSSLENQTTNHTRGHGQAAHNGDTHQAFLCNLVINERPKAGGLEIGGFFLEKQVVVSPSLTVVPELEVAKAQVVETLTSSLRCVAENFR